VEKENNGSILNQTPRVIINCLCQGLCTLSISRNEGSTLFLFKEVKKPIIYRRILYFRNGILQRDTGVITTHPSHNPKNKKN
jgi:hypothetical protein